MKNEHDFKAALKELEQEIQKAMDCGYPLHDDPYTKAIQAALEIAAEQKTVDVSVLFCDPKGVYSVFNNLDLWCKDRDATNYKGNNPVIAHPPCQKWGAMALVNYSRWGGDHNKPDEDGGMFLSALQNVERCGGVLEHPAKTRAFEKYGLQKPEHGKWKKSRKGWVCEVWQSAYGHRANKATWLYYVGKKKPFNLRWDRQRGVCQVGYQDQRGKSKNKPTLSKREANATPIEFALELIKLATLDKGYLRTPDTEKDRVLELMAGALEHWVQHSHHPCQLTDEALSEYEKLKGEKQ